MRKLLCVFISLLLVVFSASYCFASEGFEVNNDFAKDENGSLPYSTEYKENKYILMKQANETTVTWTEEALDEEDEAVLKSHINTKDPSTNGREMKFIVGFGNHGEVGKNYGNLSILHDELRQLIIVSSDKSSYSHFGIGTFKTGESDSNVDPDNPNGNVDPDDPDNPQDPDNPNNTDDPDNPNNPDNDNPNEQDDPGTPIDDETNNDDKSDGNDADATDDATAKTVDKNTDEAVATGDGMSLALLMGGLFISALGVICIISEYLRRRSDTEV